MTSSNLLLKFHPCFHLLRWPQDAAAEKYGSVDVYVTKFGELKERSFPMEEKVLLGGEDFDTFRFWVSMILKLSVFFGMFHFFPKRAR